MSKRCEVCGTPKTISIAVASGRGVAERWRSQYSRNGEWTKTAMGQSKDIYDRLCALGPDPDIAAVAEVIGNKSWSYLTCSGCNEHVGRAASFGSDDTILLCIDCLTGGSAALRGGK